MKKAPENNKITDKYELVNPAVYVGWIPPKGFENNYGFSIPCLVVMTDSGIDDNDSAEIKARIKIITYDSGIVKENNEHIPSLTGYKDLLNVIDKIRIKLSENLVINDKVSHKKPIEWGIDEEQHYPIWSGEISFPVSILSLKPDIDSYLNLNE